MAIKSKSKTAKQFIDLTGPDGNAFVLLGIARRLANQLSLDWEKIKKEMTMTDYENLVVTFDKYFGDYVDLHR